MDLILAVTFPLMTTSMDETAMLSVARTLIGSDLVPLLITVLVLGVMTSQVGGMLSIPVTCAMALA